nr:MAG TPA: hypothetical protein [Caudoviricetes sp.]
MRRNANDFLGPCECELSRAQMNGLFNGRIVILVG